MNIVFFTHPGFMASQSMPRYTQWLAEGMKKRGHNVVIYQPQAKFYNRTALAPLKKWMGYIDQYVIFPKFIKAQLRGHTAETLYVFTDHALGPWVPLVKNYNHVVHCHDFLAQQSALGEIEQNKVGLTGRIYQRYIREGFQQARHFISISKQTQENLHQFVDSTPQLSEIVYNGLNRTFKPTIHVVEARVELTKRTNVDLSKGYVLHVGGNQWYKNRAGTILVYNAWRAQSKIEIPLLMVGAAPTANLRAIHQQSPYREDIHFFVGMDDDFISQTYAAASAFLFPSIAEGFGWPIAEAMASGCPVITTNKKPMNEVGGQACFYIDVIPNEHTEITKWATKSALVVEKVVTLTERERHDTISRGLENANRFDPEKALDNIERIYMKIIQAS